jgi:hypothetical protein
MVFVYPSDLTSGVLQLSTTSRADSKLAPATALGSVYAEHNGTIDSNMHVHAFGRPGLQYGATTAIADNTVISTVDYSYDYSVGAKLQTDVAAEAGQGQAISLGRSHGDSKQGVTRSRVKSTAYASRW